MTTPFRIAVAPCLLLIVFGAGCASTRSSQLHATPPGLGRLPYSDADVDFLAGMIPHHAQAVVMAGWAPTQRDWTLVRPFVKEHGLEALGRVIFNTSEFVQAD